MSTKAARKTPRGERRWPRCPKGILSVDAVARRVGKSPTQVRRWHDAGILPAHSELPLRFRAQDADRAAAIAEKRRCKAWRKSGKRLAQLVKSRVREQPPPDPDWHTPEEAEERFPPLKSGALRAWINGHWCPKLGRALRVEKRPRGRIRRSVLKIHANDLALLQTTSDPPSSEAVGWPTAREVEEKHGFSPSLIYRWRQEGCAALEGRTLRSRREKKKRWNGVSWRSPQTLNPNDIDAIVRWNDAARRTTSSRLAAKEASKKYRLSVSYLDACAANERCATLGRPLDAQREARELSDGRTMEVWTFEEPDLRELAEKLGKPLPKLATNGKPATDSPTNGKPARKGVGGRKPKWNKLLEVYDKLHPGGDLPQSEEVEIRRRAVARHNQRYGAQKKFAEPKHLKQALADRRKRQG